MFYRPEGSVEFGHYNYNSYLGHGVRRDALLTTAGKPGGLAYGRG